jgi:hypothetical protein
MSGTSIDEATGDLLLSGKRVFPLGLSDPPPVDGVAPSGLPAWEEIAAAGVNFVRNYSVWTRAAFAEQLSSVVTELDAAERHGLRVWLALAGVDRDLSHAPLLEALVDAVKGHPGLGVWKGVDEPALGRVPPAGLVAVRERLRALDSNHPLAIVEAPRSPAATAGGATRPLTVAALRPYAAACDIHGVDIYPVSVPPGLHAGGPPVSTDIGVVGDVTKIVARATPQKAIWTTLQIAWSGVLPPHPAVFPTLQQARFMAYDAVIAGARGLFFFGGQLTQIASPADRARGWNWTYWQHVQRPLVAELSDGLHAQALLAPPASEQVTPSDPRIVASTRRAGRFVYVIAARRSAVAGGTVRFSGLPAGTRGGIVLAHGPSNPSRPIAVADGGFVDPSPFGAHNARVYRFEAPS